MAGVAVFASGDRPRRTAATTDARAGSGSPRVLENETLVFAEKVGFRFGGAIVKPGDASVEIALARVEEPPLALLKTLPPLLTRAEEEAIWPGRC